MKKFLKIIGICVSVFIIPIGLVLFFLYLAMPKAGAPPRIINHVSEIDEYLKSITDNQTPPAIAITVLKKGKTVYAKAFGYADWPEKKPAHIDIIYPWWSVTKLFTATAIMQLYEKGNLSLDDPLKKYIPGFEVTGKDGKSKTITIRQLLTHESGLKDLMPDGLNWVRLADKPGINQTAFFMEKMTGKYRVLKFEPGTKASYTNVGYIALGVVIEAITGLGYEEYIHKNILNPLNMNNTSFIRNEKQQLKTATGSNPVINIFTGLMWVFGHKDYFKTYVRETRNGRIWFKPLYTNYTPSTGLSGPSLEMARFAQAFLQGGVFNGRRILNQEIVDMMFIPYNPDELGTSYDDVKYGLGWKVWKVNNQIVYGHGGGGPGFGALLTIFPERDLVIAINANDTNIDRDKLIGMLASITWENF